MKIFSNVFVSLILLLFTVCAFSQGVVNNGARIVSQSGTYWVVSNGAFTLRSESAANVATMANLKIEADASLTLTPQSYLTVSGTLTNSSGADGLILQSTADGTSSLIHSTANVDATINRYITGNSVLTAKTYHFVSVPLSPATNSTAALFTGAYLYDFTPLTNSWHALGASSTTPLDETRGYMIYTPEVSHTYTFSGPMNVGTFSPLIVNEGAGNNLVPNPYPSAIDWNASGWTKDNIANSIYIWPSGGSNYATYVDGAATNGGSNIIPEGQAFIVKANGIPAFSMTDAVRVHNDQPFFKSGDEILSMLSIQATANEITDEAVVRFTGEATTQADPDFDAWKLYGNSDAPQLYTVAADKEKLAINSLPFSTTETVVPLDFELGTSTTCTFAISGTESFDPSVTIFLEDVLTGNMVNLKQQNSYAFEHSTGSDASRFKLHFNGVTSIAETQAQILKMWIHDVSLYISAPELTGNHALVEIYNIPGQRIYSNVLTLNEFNVINPGVKGMVLVRLVSAGNVFTCKGIINL